MTQWPWLPHRRQSGFTLIELITVMIIIGIMAVIVLPRFDLLKGFDEIGYRDKVKATLEYARKSAVAQRRNVRVVVASNQMTVTVEQATPEGDSGAPGTYGPLNLPGSSNNSFGAPSGTTLSSAAVLPLTITFDALGRPSPAAVFTVSGGAGNITVEAETGYVH